MTSLNFHTHVHKFSCCTCALTHNHELSVVYSKSSQRKENQPRDHSERKRQHSPPPSSLHSSQPATKMARHSNERSEEKRKKSSYTKHDSGKSKAVRDKVNSREQCWMASHLRVRIVDQGYQRGKYYNNKVRNVVWCSNYSTNLMSLNMTCKLTVLKA